MSVWLSGCLSYGGAQNLKQEKSIFGVYCTTWTSNKARRIYMLALVPTAVPLHLHRLKTTQPTPSSGPGYGVAFPVELLAHRLKQVNRLEPTTDETNNNTRRATESALCVRYTIHPSSYSRAGLHLPLNEAQLFSP